MCRYGHYSFANSNNELIKFIAEIPMDNFKNILIFYNCLRCLSKLRLCDWLTFVAEFISSHLTKLAAVHQPSTK